ncbi:10678_t:CDS:2, partial [Dentiscutata heterogama]
MQYSPVDQCQSHAALIEYIQSFGASYGYGISITKSKPNKTLSIQDPSYNHKLSKNISYYQFLRKLDEQAQNQYSEMTKAG